MEHHQAAINDPEIGSMIREVEETAAVEASECPAWVEAV